MTPELTDYIRFIWLAAQEGGYIRKYAGQEPSRALPLLGHPLNGKGFDPVYWAAQAIWEGVQPTVIVQSDGKRGLCMNEVECTVAPLIDREKIRDVGLVLEEAGLILRAKSDTVREAISA